MHSKRIGAFTLLELMVAVIIIGILLAVSGPIYTSYTIKARFTEVLGNIHQYRDDLQAAYQDNDKFPSSFNGISSATYNALTSGVLQQVYYGIGASGATAYLQFFTLDLGVPDYVAADSSGTGGANCRLTLAAVTTDVGVTRYYCGQWDGTDVDVPLTYLPSTCQDTNISALIS